MHCLDTFSMEAFFKHEQVPTANPYVPPPPQSKEISLVPSVPIRILQVKLLKDMSYFGQSSSFYNRSKP